jgi:hypothetical protein
MLPANLSARFGRGPLLQIALTIGVLGAVPLACAAPPPLTGSEEARINNAIFKGVRFLVLNQFPPGTWGGSPGGGHEVSYAALPGLTLLECGVSPSNLVVMKAADYVRQACPSLTTTYELALVVLFLDRLGIPEDRKLIQVLALRLIAGQTTTGGWSYGCPALSPPEFKQVLVLLRQRNIRPDSIPASLQGLAVLHPISDLIDLKAPATDNSNTQFATLAIWTASRHGIPVRRTLELLNKRFRDSQNTDGTWGYAFGTRDKVPGGPPTTCAGLLGVGIANGLALKTPTDKGQTFSQTAAKRLARDPAVQNGFAALEKSVGVPSGKMDGLPMGNLYYLWSLERVAVLYNLTDINGKDWYRWGAETLVANQKADGNWEGSNYPGSTPKIDTCLALLFLKRTNLTDEFRKRLQTEMNDLAKSSLRLFLEKNPEVGSVLAAPDLGPLEFLPFLFTHASQPAAAAPIVANVPPPAPPPPPTPAKEKVATTAPPPVQPEPVSPLPAPSEPPPEQKAAVAKALPPAQAPPPAPEEKDTKLIGILLGAGALVLLAGSGLLLMFYRREARSGGPPSERRRPAKPKSSAATLKKPGRPDNKKLPRRGPAPE